MQEQNEEKIKFLDISFYKGILFGIRTYEESGYKAHVLYLPIFIFISYVVMDEEA